MNIALRFVAALENFWKRVALRRLRTAQRLLGRIELFGEFYTPGQLRTLLQFYVDNSNSLVRELRYVREQLYQCQTTSDRVAEELDALEACYLATLDQLKALVDAMEATK